MNPRNIWLVVMVAAIGVSLYIKSGGLPENQAAELRRTQERLMLRLLSSEALLVPEMPGDQTKMKKQISDQLEMIRSQTQNRNEFEIQNFIIQYQAGLSPSAPAAGDVVSLRDLNSLYVEGKPVAAESPLFALAAGNLAKLKQAEVSKSTDYTSMRAEMLARARLMELGAGFLALGFFGLIVTGGITLFFFFRSKPPVAYFQKLQIIDSEAHRSMLESAVLYVFLIFPVGLVIQQYIPKNGVDPLLLSLVHLTGSFACSLLYFRSQSGTQTLRDLILPPGTKIFTEAVIGVLGFAAIFPLALFMLLITAGGTDSVRFAHPAAFEAQRNPILMLILAAGFVPIFEEVVFRCFLYGYFRREQRLRFAALFSGILFAILHPQGILAYPYLTVLGMGLAVIREYRESAVASIVAHACVNGSAVVLTWAVSNVV